MHDAVSTWGLKDKYVFNMNMLKNDIPWVVRAMDNVVDRATYPLSEQEEGQKQKTYGIGCYWCC